MTIVTHLVDDVEGWLHPSESQALYAFAGMRHGMIIVEIGAWKGKSTICLAAGLKGDGRVYTIDPFDGAGEESSSKDYDQNKGSEPLFSQFQRNIQRKGVEDKITPVIGMSCEVVSKIPNTFDLLFIDGDHSIAGSALDYLLYMPRLKQNGILMIHDYYPERPRLGPTWVVEHYAVHDCFKIDVFDTLWCGRKL